jgi:hypothetical protein
MRLLLSRSDGMPIFLAVQITGPGLDSQLQLKTFQNYDILAWKFLSANIHVNRRVETSHLKPIEFAGKYAPCHKMI